MPLEPSTAKNSDDANSSSMIRRRNYENGVALVELNRPEKRNALSQAMITELVATLRDLDKESRVRSVVLTSANNGPFSAGVDLSELVHISTAEAHSRRFLCDLTDAFASFRKPIIAAVIGFALGGGFEIALACDIIYAATNSKFGFPEITIGTIPGAGGTQRLTRAIGKQKAMEFILTGETASGSEFERLGIVNKIFPPEEVITKAVELAEKIAKMSSPIAQLAKKAVLTAEQTHLDAGMELEKSLYYATFGHADKEVGMRAFLEKRKPVFEHR
ncbi:enoyl-CoA hydratase/isomerase [Tothia fuscella]|uniref:Enoyl-CoA hydratase/isomerase n=1 Tax=Tothia fuscella TaxID=1048955 RepID=A0A9P4P0F8_9PEZI|nr:enoyl-CoA hydratase/isomerase [Tothia fuscella]